MSVTSSGQDWAALFSEEFAAEESAVEARVWAAVLGEEYPAEVAPYSFTSRSELKRMAAEVHVGPAELLVDVGSGRGGPGLWVAAATGARYLAVDIAVAGLAEVQRRAAALGLADRAQIAEGSFEDLPLADGQADAVMSIDALLFTPDKAAAVRELARVLRPGGRLVLTSWDYHRQPAGRPPQVGDHRPLLEAAGFGCSPTTTLRTGSAATARSTACSWPRLTTWPPNGACLSPTCARISPKCRPPSMP